MELGRRLRLTYYESPTEPRLMLFGPADVDIKSLQDSFRNLSAKEGTVALHESDFVAAFGGVKLFAVCTGPIARTPRPSGWRQGLHRPRPRELTFEWHRSAEGWDYLAELIAPLAEPGQGPGHQYLTRFPGEAAVIVVSRGEYTDSVAAGEIAYEAT